MLGIILAILGIILYMRNRRRLSILILLLLLSSGAQVVPASVLTAGLPIDKVSDYGLLQLVTLLTLLLALGHRSVLSAVGSNGGLAIISFFAFLAASAIYSIAVLGYDIVNVLQVARTYLPLLSFFLFRALTSEECGDVMRVAILFTAALCLVYVSQALFGFPVLLSYGGDSVVTTLDVDGYVRAYNVPVLASFSLIALSYSGLRGAARLIAAALLLGAIVLSLHRGALIAVCLAGLVLVLVAREARGVMSISLLAMPLIVVLMSSSLLLERVSTAFGDISTLWQRGGGLAATYSPESTIEFRAAHFIERLDYIADEPERWIFGIGLISDNSPLASRLPFSVGLKARSSGQTLQIDTADILWSLLVLNLGIAGLLLYVSIYVFLTLRFLKLPAAPHARAVGIAVVVYALISSLTSTEVMLPLWSAAFMLLSASLRRPLIGNPA